MRPRREKHTDRGAAAAIVRHAPSPSALRPHPGAEPQPAGGAGRPAAEQLQRQRRQPLG